MEGPAEEPDPLLLLPASLQPFFGKGANGAPPCSGVLSKALVEAAKKHNESAAPGALVVFGAAGNLTKTNLFLRQGALRRAAMRMSCAQHLWLR